MDESGDFWRSVTTEMTVRHNKREPAQPAAFQSVLAVAAAVMQRGTPQKKKSLTGKSGKAQPVPPTGIEPVRCFHRGILSPLRLPVPPQRRRAGINLTHLTIALRKSQAQGLTNPHRALYNTLVNSKKGIDRVSAAPPPPERKPPAERLSAVPVHHSRPRAIGVRNAGVPGALNRQKRQRPTALQSGWYHGRFGFRPYGFAKEAGEESCFYFSPIARKMQKKKGIYPL